MNTHCCPVTGCIRALPFRLLMCRAHWASVPRHLQDEVNRTWRTSHTARGVAPYMAARQAAIDAVNAQLAPEVRP